MNGSLYSPRPLIPYETAVLRLPEEPSEGRRILELAPSVVFQPFALLFWSAAPGSLVHQVHVHEEQLTGALPANMFEAEVSWDYFLALSERRLDGVEVIDHRSMGKFFRFHMPVLSAGRSITLDVEGAYRHGVIVGRTPRIELPAPEPGVFSTSPGVS